MELGSEAAYLKAMKAGQRAVRAAQAENRNPYMVALEDSVPDLNQLTHVPLGLLTVPLDRIVGSVSAGRTPAFSAGFLPLLGEGTEFCAKWRSLYESVLQEGVREAVKLVEYMGQFYAIEGNKRISVSRFLESGSIDADVVRIIPKRTDTKENRVYFEFLAFYADTGIFEIEFTEEGGFAELVEQSGHMPGVKWPEDDVKSLRSAYYRVSAQVASITSQLSRLKFGDIMLIYAQAYGYNALLNDYETEMHARLVRLREEINTMAHQEPLALKMSDEGQAPGLLRQLFRTTPNLNVCFINTRNPEVSGWTYWHLLGRNHLENVFDGKKVTSRIINDVSPADCQQAIEDAVKDGANVVFTTSPVLLDGAMKAAIKLPQAKILNCSLLPMYHSVRSYYLRMYEAKFILGAIAGAMADNDRIGYIADYPVYGIPTSVNAFALGVRMTNPRAKVYLEWSTLLDHNPDDALAALDVPVICNRDIAAPAFESTVFGLYEIKDGKTQNLAMPVWQWGKLYEALIHRIQIGMWDTDTTDGQDAQALNYWWGMEEGVIDVYYSKRLDPGTKRLIEMLREGLLKGVLNPFSGLIVSQDGTVRCKDDESLQPAQLITMDWLCDNIIGEIPDISKLKPEARPFVELQGIGVARAPELSEIDVQDTVKN